MRPPSRTRALRSLAAALAAVVALGACSSTPSRDDVVDSLERTGVSHEVAGCVADAFFDILSDEEIARIAERGSTGVIDDQDVDDERIDRARRAMSECRNLDAPTTTEVDETRPGSEPTEDPEASADDPAAAEHPVKPDRSDDSTADDASNSDGSGEGAGASTAEGSEELETSDGS